jgi:hypothetical protein
VSDRPPPSEPPKRAEDDDAPALEVVEDHSKAPDASDEDDALADDELDHDPTSQGLGFDAVGFLSGGTPARPDEKKREAKKHAQTGQGLGFDPVARMLGLAPRSSVPPPPSAPEQARQTMPTRSASQKPEKPALHRISTQDFDAPDVPKALAEAETALAASPHDAEALRLVMGLRRQLERVYTAQLTPITRKVRRIPSADVASLEDEARFLLSFVDGTLTIAQVIDASAMTPVDAMRVLASLADKGVIAFR